jgi:hypothetical protein
VAKYIREVYKKRNNCRPVDRLHIAGRPFSTREQNGRPVIFQAVDRFGSVCKNAEFGKNFENESNEYIIYYVIIAKIYCITRIIYESKIIYIMEF